MGWTFRLLSCGVGTHAQPVRGDSAFMSCVVLPYLIFHSPALQPRPAGHVAQGAWAAGEGQRCPRELQR